jgi:divalent metal cation (Fe/Co/Zn/Cd) transporter
VTRIVREVTGRPPRQLRFLYTDEGLLAHLTLALDPGTPLADAHARASEVEERLRLERPDISDVIVHTEP